MAKPAQTTELDEARRIIGMIQSVLNKSEYMEIFGISGEKIDYYRELLQNRQINKVNFREKL